MYFLLLALIAVVAACTPAPPTLTFLYAVNLTSGAETVIGTTPTGLHLVQPVTGGAFAGPSMRGNVTTGIDYGFSDSNSTFHPKAVYVLETDDGATILVTETGRAPNIQVVFDTASPTYDYLNRAVGYATGSQGDGVVSLDVWQITPP